MRLSRLGGDNNSCSILGGLQSDGLADTTAGAGDQDSLSCEFTIKRKKNIN
jgi:hypothetical protein